MVYSVYCILYTHNINLRISQADDEIEQNNIITILHFSSKAEKKLIKRPSFK